MSSENVLPSAPQYSDTEQQLYSQLPLPPVQDNSRLTKINEVAANVNQEVPHYRLVAKNIYKKAKTVKTGLAPVPVFFRNSSHLQALALHLAKLILSLQFLWGPSLGFWPFFSRNCWGQQKRKNSSRKYPNTKKSWQSPLQNVTRLTALCRKHSMTTRSRILSSKSSLTKWIITTLSKTPFELNSHESREKHCFPSTRPRKTEKKGNSQPSSRRVSKKDHKSSGRSVESKFWKIQHRASVSLHVFF